MNTPIVKTVIRLKITGANIPLLITQMSNASIAAYDMQYIDELNICLSVTSDDMKKLTELLDKYGNQYDIQSKNGLLLRISKLKKRMVLITCILILLFTTVWLPTRVFFISVEGNAGISDEFILSQAEACGIYFGAARREVRSEQIKNALLKAIPELKWAGINTYGCCAVISVLEREETPSSSLNNGIGAITAARDGVICEITAIKGTPLCKVGQAVRAGQVLISGYSDRGLVVRAGQAEGEIRAVTQRAFEAVIPPAKEYKEEVINKNIQFSLLFGKKEIKLYKDSGNSPAGCGRIESVHVLTLPGGFQLPVALIAETIETYDVSQQSDPRQIDDDEICMLARTYIKGQMIAGEILDHAEIVSFEDNQYFFKGVYSCIEMIGKVQKEEIENLG